MHVIAAHMGRQQTQPRCAQTSRIASNTASRRTWSR
jgi:hypothetical protein